jgi:A/G-specific adenine glycosylase
LGALRKALLNWYRKSRRDLPWRKRKDAYAIWVSEIMLQQTRVETVIPYYTRFLKAFPSVRALAKAPQSRVLKLWEGLGYYTRARNLHEAARAVVRKKGGRLPRDAAAWRRLPGIGEYTAAAVASIAFGETVPAVDGNARRVFTRLFGVRTALGEADTERTLKALGGALLARRAPGDFNQAVMELGARICTPRRPSCDVCPVGRSCEARAQGDPDRLPRTRRKARPPHHDVVAAVIRRRGRILIGRRPPRGLLGGLWEFPGGKVEAGETFAGALRREVREEIGLAIRPGGEIASVDHAYSHFTITFHLFEAEARPGDAQARFHTDLKWVFPSQMGRYAFPGATRKVLPAVAGSRR